MTSKASGPSAHLFVLVHPQANPACWKTSLYSILSTRLLWEFPVYYASLNSKCHFDSCMQSSPWLQTSKMQVIGLCDLRSEEGNQRTAIGWKRLRLVYLNHFSNILNSFIHSTFKWTFLLRHFRIFLKLTWTYKCCLKHNQNWSDAFELNGKESILNLKPETMPSQRSACLCSCLENFCFQTHHHFTKLKNILWNIANQRVP